MLIATPVGEGLAGAADVKLLQSALKDYAVARNAPAVDPGAIDGIVGPKTISAVAAIIGSIKGVPSGIALAVRLAVAGGALIPQFLDGARRAIESSAAVLAIGVRLAMVVPGGGAGQIPMPGGVPTGTIHFFDARLGRFRIAVPIGLAGFGEATHVEIAPVATAPTGSQPVTESEFLDKTDQKPWYKKPLIWVGVGAGLLVVGTGTYFIARRRR